MPGATRDSPSPRLAVSASALLTLAGLAAAAATLLGFLSAYAWYLDLFAHLRVQYFVGLALVALLLLILRRRKAAAVFALFAAVNLAVILPFFFGGTRPPPGAGPALRALLLNVNTGRGDPDRQTQPGSPGLGDEEKTSSKKQTD